MYPDERGSDATGFEDDGRFSKPRKAVLEAEKGQETDSTLNLPNKKTKNTSLQHLGVRLVRLISDF